MSDEHKKARALMELAAAVADQKPARVVEIIRALEWRVGRDINILALSAEEVEQMFRGRVRGRDYSAAWKRVMLLRETLAPHVQALGVPKLTDEQLVSRLVNAANKGLLRDLEIIWNLALPQSKRKRIRDLYAKAVAADG